MQKPLQLFGTLGVILDVVGGGIIFYLVYVKYAYGLHLMEYRAPLFIFALLLIVIGVLFFILGLLGELIVKFFHDFAGTKIYSIVEIHNNPNNRKG
jgi:dolichol-phosphate mannosyltransferase